MPLSSANSSLKLGEFEKTKRYRAICWCSNGGLSTARLGLLESRIKVCQAPPQSETGIAELGHKWPPQELQYHPILRRPLPFIQIDPGFIIHQLTPIRVLHRRSLSTRQRRIHWIRLGDVNAVFAEDAPFEVNYIVSWPCYSTCLVSKRVFIRVFVNHLHRDSVCINRIHLKICANKPIGTFHIVVWGNKRFQ